MILIRNSITESFNSKIRDKLLDREIFTTLEEAKVLIKQWKKEYNRVCPHSALGYRLPVPEAILTAATSQEPVSLPEAGKIIRRNQ